MPGSGAGPPTAADTTLVSRAAARRRHSDPAGAVGSAAELRTGVPGNVALARSYARVADSSRPCSPSSGASPSAGSVKLPEPSPEGSVAAPAAVPESLGGSLPNPNCRWAAVIALVCVSGDSLGGTPIAWRTCSWTGVPISQRLNAATPAQQSSRLTRTLHAGVVPGAGFVPGSRKYRDMRPEPATLTSRAKVADSRLRAAADGASSRGPRGDACAFVGTVRQRPKTHRGLRST